MKSPIVNLLIVVAESIVEVFLVSLVGYFLARKGILSPGVRKSINRLNVSLMTPALLFSKVAFSLTPSKLADLYIVPIGFVIVTVVSMGTAWLLGTLFRLKKSQVAFAVACAGFPNSNSLPVALMQSLIVSVAALKWGEDDTEDAMLGRALSYLVLFSTLGIILRWSVGVKLLSIADDPPEILKGSSVAKNGNTDSPALVASPPALAQEPEEQPLLIDQVNAQSIDNKRRSAHFPTSSSDEEEEDTNPGAPQGLQHKKASRRGYFPSFPNTPSNFRSPSTSRATSAASVDGDDSDEEHHSDPEWGASRGSGAKQRTKPSRSKFQSSMRKGWTSTKRFTIVWIWRPLKKTLKVIKGFMTVPLYAALLSLGICFIPPLQHFLEELKPLRGALTQTGNCSIPLTLLVLGSFMVQEEDTSKKSESSKPQAKPSLTMINGRPRMTKRTSLIKSTAPAQQGESRTVFVALLSRMIIAPALLLPLLYFYSLNETSVADDPIFIVTATVLIGSPPALTLAQITDAASGEQFERLISKTMLWGYAVLTGPTTILLCILGLWIDQQ